MPTVPELRRARLATATVFVLLGVVQGTLASRMPALKAHAGLSDGLLGLALLGVPVGSVLAVQVTGRWIAWRGSAPVTAAGAVIMCVTSVAPAYATTFALLAGALVLLGVGIGLTDTAMNAHAVLVEKGHARPIMGSFHAFASLGNLVGALLGAGAARLALAPQTQFPVVAAVALVLTLVVRRGLLPGRDDAAGPSDPVVDEHGVTPPGPLPRPGARWSGTLVLLAVVALLAWMSEHAVADWSAVYLRDRLGASASLATYGYALFAAAMVATRFLSDRVVARFGPRRVLRWGGLLAGVGLTVGLATGTVAGGVVGFGLVGIGMAGVVPVVFTAAGNQPGITAGHAVSRVAGVAFTGSLVGPPLIGLVADVASLRVALLVVAAGAVLIGVLGPVALRARGASTRS
ncbi:MFS transporter [Microlunatus antarcticus]